MAQQRKENSKIGASSSRHRAAILNGENIDYPIRIDFAHQLYIKVDVNERLTSRISMGTRHGVVLEAIFTRFMIFGYKVLGFGSFLETYSGLG